MGGFLVSAFEAVALGLGYHYKRIAKSKIDLRQRIQQLWLDERFTTSLGGSPGGSINTRKRIQNILPVGREIFRP